MCLCLSPCLFFCCSLSQLLAVSVCLLGPFVHSAVSIHPPLLSLFFISFILCLSSFFSLSILLAAFSW